MEIRKAYSSIASATSRVYEIFHTTQNELEGRLEAVSLSVVHDIGKIAVPEEVLKKEGRLTEEEMQALKDHTIAGADFIGKIPYLNSGVEQQQCAYDICKYHHERYDGSGYSEGLAGDEIPISAHVVGLIDSYDALRRAKRDKNAYSHQSAVEMLLNGECGTFSPQVLEAFKKATALKEWG